MKLDENKIDHYKSLKREINSFKTCEAESFAQY